MIELHAAHGYLLASFISPLPMSAATVWRLAREPLALSARGVPRHARRLAGARSRCRCASRRPTGGRRADRRRCGRGRARSPMPAATSSTSRPARPLPTRSRCSAACSRPRSPTRSATTPPCHHVRRRHHHRRPGQHHRRRRPRRPCRAGAPAPGRPLFHHEGRGLVRRVRDPLPAAISRRQGAGFRNSARDREELGELRLKAKPKGHRDIWKRRLSSNLLPETGSLVERLFRLMLQSIAR